MKSRAFHVFIFSLVGIGSFALGIGLLSYLAAKINSESGLAPRAQFSSTAEAVEHLIKVLQTFHQGCIVIESKKFNARKRSFLIESSNTGGNPFLLYAYTEIYKHTQQEEYWKLAREQVQCLEQSIRSYTATGEWYKHPWLQKLRGDKPEAFAWGTYLHALAYFYKINGSAPAYLKEIADFLEDLDTNYQDIRKSVACAA